MANAGGDKNRLEVVELLKHFEGTLDPKSPEPITFVTDRHRQKMRDAVQILITLWEQAKELLKQAEDTKNPKGNAAASGDKEPSNQDGKRLDLSDFLKWHEVHKEGHKLWTQLMSAAIADIDPNAKGHSKLLEYLTAATEFEDVLYGLEPFYRDHTLHSLWVYLIGVKLMSEGGELGAIAQKLNWYVYNDVQQEEDGPDPLASWAGFVETCFSHVIQKKRDAIWCIMALCHDLGYSLEKLERLNEKVQAVLKYYDVSDFRHVGYTLDLEHQYLVTQCLELMAMDVRLTPGDDYLIDLKKTKAELVECIENLSKKENLTESLKNDFDRDTLRKLLMGAVSEKHKENDKDQEEDEDTGNFETLQEPALRVYDNVLTKCFRDDASYWRLCKALETKEHGVLSAYLLFKTMGLFADVYVRTPAEGWGLDDDEAVDNIIRGDILFGIAQHEFAFAHIDQMSSLAEILILCDELEEFSRLGRQLLSRKYHDTTAETSVDVTLVVPEGQADPCGTKVKIAMTYDSRHEELEEFVKFCCHKAERLCKVFSLGSEERKPYRIGEIKATFNYSEKPANNESERNHKVIFAMREDRAVDISLPCLGQGEGSTELECRDDNVYVVEEDIVLERWLVKKLCPKNQFESSTAVES